MWKRMVIAIVVAMIFFLNFSCNVGGDKGTSTSANQDSSSGSGGSGSSPGESEIIGVLDTSFNGLGYVIHHNAAGGSEGDVGRDIAIDSLGRILVVGYSDKNTTSGVYNYDMVIWRYNPDGTLDTSFNGQGYVVHGNAAGGNGDDYGNAIAIDSLGRVVVVGSSYGGASRRMDMVIWRYHSNGSLDTSFGGVGYVVHHNAAGGNGDDSGNAVAIDSLGRIIVTGSSIKSTLNADMVIWRYNPDGTLDTSFNGQGYVVHGNASGGNGHDVGNAIIIDSSGKILVAGSSVGNYSDMTIWRFYSNGSLDTSFNSPYGYVTSHNVTGGTGYYDRGYGITIDSLGKILVTGISDKNVGDTDMVIWRYNPDGTLDINFGLGGYVIHDNTAGGNGHEYGYAIAVDSSRRVLVTGLSRRDPNSALDVDMVIWRYK